MWPDLAKFRHFVKTYFDFGNILMVYLVFGNILMVYLVFVKILNLLWQKFYSIGLNFMVVNGQ